MPSLPEDNELGKFTEDLSREDEMGAVIRAHIRIENILLAVVEKLTPHPQHLKKLGLDYDGYVTLALALGLKERFGPPLRALGKLRNDFAHKVDFKLTQPAVTNLYAAMATEDKAQVQSMFAQIKDLNEETRRKRFTELEPMDQFKLIAITLWAVAKAAQIKLTESGANGT